MTREYFIQCNYHTRTHTIVLRKCGWCLWIALDSILIMNTHNPFMHCVTGEIWLSFLSTYQRISRAHCPMCLHTASFPVSCMFQLRLAIVDALGPMSHIMTTSKLDEQLPRLLQGILALYKKHPDSFHVTQVREWLLISYYNLLFKLNKICFPTIYLKWYLVWIELGWMDNNEICIEMFVFKECISECLHLHNEVLIQIIISPLVQTIIYKIVQQHDISFSAKLKYNPNSCKTFTSHLLPLCSYHSFPLNSWLIHVYHKTSVYHHR